jgi:pilus assembly protein Flp/PilA
MSRNVWRQLADDSGATSIEYGLVAMLIALVVVTSVMTVGANLSTYFGQIANSL